MHYHSLPSNLMSVVLDINRALCSKTIGFSMVLARVLAYRGSLVGMQTVQEATTSLTGVRFDELVSKFNALVPVDVAKVRDYTKRYAAWRFDQATGTLSAPYAREGSECEDFFGMSKHFDAASLQEVKTESEKLVRYHVKIVAILEHILSEEAKED